MAGDVFDPAEFAAFKAGRALPVAPPAPAGADFDPAEFAAFKAAGEAPVGEPGALRIRVGNRPRTVANPLQAAPGGSPSPSPAVSQDAADTALIGPDSTGNRLLSLLFGAGQAATLNLGGNAAAGVATLLGQFGPAGLGYGDGSRTFAENYERFTGIRDALGRQNPKTALAGTVAGSLLAAPVMPGLAGPRAANAALRAGQYALTGGLYGGAAEAIDSRDAGKALGAAAGGAVAGGLLGPAVEKLAPVAVSAGRKVAAPIMRALGREPAALPLPGGFTPEAVSALRRGGFDLDTMAPNLMDSMRRTFAAKGVSDAAVREGAAGEFGIPLSRGQATQSPADLLRERFYLAGRRGAGAQQAGAGFIERQGEAIADARDLLARGFAGSGSRIDNPRAAGEAVADVARRIGDDAAFRGAAAQRGADQALEAVRGRGPVPDALEAAGSAASGVRDAAALARGAYKDAYAEVSRIPGTFAPGALDRMGSRLRDRLGADVPLDDVLTPAATRAVADLDSLPGIFNLEPGAGPNLTQVDQLRKRLVAYRGNTGQNPTDRRAMDRILAEFDGHVHDAMDAGLFGQRAAAAADDGFPGAAALDGAFPPAGGAPGASVPPPGRTGEPETLTRYLARGGGVPLDAEARAADLHRLYVPGHGTLARRNAPTWDDLRVRMAEEGFLPPGMDETASARDVADWVRDAIHAERANGRVTVRLGDEGQVGARRTAEGIADQNADHLAMVDRQARRMTIDLEGYGFRPRDLDRDALNEAAERMVLGHADDAADAYEAALTRRASEGGRRVEAPPEIPFESPGAAPSPAAGDGFPMGDTAPSDAMRRARGLFREYQQAFRPRGPGDAAGRNLQRIVEADASPNEVASMLFGGSTGRVTGRQLKTLDRLKATVGEDSEAWRATQQAVMSRYLDGRDVGRSLDYLLRGEGRDLAARVLTAQQRAGLDAFRTGIQKAEAARATVPDWVQDIARTGYDPNRVLADLFGSGIPGARPGSAAFGRGLRQYLGPDSPEWSGLRQAAWMRLTQAGENAPALTARREAERIRAFISAEGKGLAEALFSKPELAQMSRYADAVSATHIPNGKRFADGGRAAALGDSVLSMIVTATGAKLGGPFGAIASRITQGVAQNGIAGVSARRAFNNGAPRIPEPLQDYAGRAGTAAGALGGLGVAGVIR